MFVFRMPAYGTNIDGNSARVRDPDHAGSGA
jgi:hypothetical protein